VKGDVYGFRVKDVEITEVAEMAEMTEEVRGIWITARHVIWPVCKAPEGFEGSTWARVHCGEVPSVAQGVPS
jgi:hypothetical protein